MSRHKQLNEYTDKYVTTNNIIFNVKILANMISNKQDVVINGYKLSVSFFNDVIIMPL